MKNKSLKKPNDNPCPRSFDQKHQNIKKTRRSIVNKLNINR